jgi:hypothetical protein
VAGLNAAIADANSTKGLIPTVNTSRRGGAKLTVVPAGQPLQRVKLDTGSWGAALAKVLARGVPIPNDAAPAGTTDAGITVYQPSSDRLWELWRASRRSDGWHAQWGGALSGVSRSPGFYTSSAWPGLKPDEGWNWGASASSMVGFAGVIRSQELRARHIAHAIGMLVPDACAGVFAWPAQRTDGQNRSPGCLPEGAKLRLDPSLDLDKLELPSATKTIARAAQDYGLIVHDDTNGQTVGFDGEAYDGRGGDPFGGLPSWKLLQHFPWRHLQLTRMRLCTHWPCRVGS